LTAPLGSGNSTGRSEFSTKQSNIDVAGSLAGYFAAEGTLLQGAIAKAKPGPQIKLSKLGEDDRLLLIYRAAAKVIHAKGYDATSLNDIAEAVGITKGGLYHYIDGKQSLLFKIMSYAMDILELEVVAPTRPLLDAQERLHAVIRLHTQLIIDKGIELTILLDESAGLTPEHLRLITARRVEYYQFVKETIARLKREGKLRDLDVTIATHNLIGQLQWLPRWYVPGGRLLREEVIERFSDAALKALLRAKPNSRSARSQSRSAARSVSVDGKATSRSASRHRK
jgi:AcrR family transcriptional regulator